VNQFEVSLAVTEHRPGMVIDALAWPCCPVPPAGRTSLVSDRPAREGENVTELQGPAERTRHWDRLYRRLDETQVSWFESDPTCSMALLNALGVSPDLSVVDIGAGAFRLIDTLLARGFLDLTALDVSDEGLTQTEKRLGRDATRVHWVVTDVLTCSPGRRFDVWHDRAVFHFLTDPTDQVRYMNFLTQALTAQGQVVIGRSPRMAPRNARVCQ
jgi:2-polyprenyl-3-methyl-5-hydroxy-6-metoxy-1,4-benzoquinol methylase